MHLLTYQETADYLKLTIGTIYQMICAGRLPYVTLPSKGKRIVKEELDKMLIEGIFIPRPRLRITNRDQTTKVKRKGVIARVV